MPDSPMPQASPETGSSMPPGGPPPGANVGGAGQAPANLPPQGAPVGQPAKALGMQAQAREIVRKVIIPGLEKTFNNLGGSLSEDGKVIFEVIGKLSKHFGKSDGGNEALESSMRQQMTRKPGGAPPGGAAPQPPTGPIPQPSSQPA